MGLKNPASLHSDPLFDPDVSLILAYYFPQFTK
jgi:hypothetical protein